MKKAINAIIIQDKKLLLFRKNSTWILPGGKPKERESELETLAREFKEEASGAEIIIENYYGSFIGITPHSQKVLRAITYFSRLKNPNHELKYSREISEIGFFDYFEIGKLNVSDITKKAAANLAKDKYL